MTKINFEEILDVPIHSGCHYTCKQKDGLLALDCLICQCEYKSFYQQIDHII